jgi:hypothetical protein
MIQCHYCKTVCSRRWNLDVHIQRKHGNKRAAQELSKATVNARASIAQANIRGGAKRPTSFVSKSLHYEAQPYIDNPTDSHSQGSPNLVENFVSMMKPLAELKKIINELNGPKLMFASPMEWTQAPEWNLQSPNILKYLPSSDSLPFGYKVHLCERCLTNTLMVVKYVHEQEPHLCNMKDLNVNRKPGESFDIFRKLVDNSGRFLFQCVSNFKSPSLDLLRAVRLGPQEPIGIEITNPSNPDKFLPLFAEREKNITQDLDMVSCRRNEKTLNWMASVCSNGWAKLDRDELYAYLELVKNAT